MSALPPTDQMMVEPRGCSIEFFSGPGGLPWESLLTMLEHTFEVNHLREPDHIPMGPTIPLPWGTLWAYRTFDGGTIVNFHEGP